MAGARAGGALERAGGALSLGQPHLDAKGGGEDEADECGGGRAEQREDHVDSRNVERNEQPKPCDEHGEAHVPRPLAPRAPPAEDHHIERVAAWVEVDRVRHQDGDRDRAKGGQHHGGAQVGVGDAVVVEQVAPP